jgi:PAS domain S-box-containing protein
MGIKTDSVNENLIVISEEGRFRSSNTWACEVLWTEKDEPIGQPAKIISSKNEPLIKGPGFRLIREEDFRKERGNLLSKRGRKLPVWFATSSCLGIDGELDVFTIIAQDTEANRQSQETLDEWPKQLTGKYRIESISSLVTGRVDRSLNQYELRENTAEAMRRYLDVEGQVSMIHKEGH